MWTMNDSVNAFYFSGREYYGAGRYVEARGNV